MKVRFPFAGKFHSWLIGMVVVGIVILGLFFSTHQSSIPSVPIPTISGDVSFVTGGMPLSANTHFEDNGKWIDYLDEPTTLEKLWTTENHHILVGVTNKFGIAESIHPYDLLLGKNHFAPCEGNVKRVNDFWFYVYKADRSESTTGFEKARYGISPCAAWRNMFPSHPSNIENMIQIKEGDLLYIELTPEEHDKFTQRIEEARIEYVRPCGNGRMDSGEQCDDGNVVAMDGCSTQCQVEQGFSCEGTPSLCTRLCGNGVLDTFEVCDDGNRNNGDGCTQSCAVESEWRCSGQPSVCHKPCGDGMCRLEEGENSIDCRQDCTDPTYSFAPLPDLQPWVRQAGARGSNPNCGQPGTINCVHSIKAHSYGYLVVFRPSTSPGPQKWGYYNKMKQYVFPSFWGQELSANFFEGPPYSWTKPFFHLAGDYSTTLSVIKRVYANGTTGMPQDTVLDSVTIAYTVVEPPSAERLQFAAFLRNAGAQNEHIEVTGKITDFDQNSEQMSRDDPTSGPKKIYPNVNGDFAFKIWKQAQNTTMQDDLVFLYDLATHPCPVDLMLHDAYKPVLQGAMWAYKKVCVAMP